MGFLCIQTKFSQGVARCAAGARRLHREGMSFLGAIAKLRSALDIDPELPIPRAIVEMNALMGLDGLVFYKLAISSSLIFYKGY